MNNGWNPWHGCHKLSEGCLNCYVYRIDAMYGRKPDEVKPTGQFWLPIQKTKTGEYKYHKNPNEYVMTCFTSDFLLPEADIWRIDAWKMMKERADLKFMFVTKRIDRLESVLPNDWGDGYDNVHITCTIESQRTANYRLPIFDSLPIKERSICIEPILEPINLNLNSMKHKPMHVLVGGESGSNARECRLSWIHDIRNQCIDACIENFWFKQTGANFVFDTRNPVEYWKVTRHLQYSTANSFRLSYGKHF